MSPGLIVLLLIGAFAALAAASLVGWMWADWRRYQDTQRVLREARRFTSNETPWPKGGHMADRGLK